MFDIPFQLWYNIDKKGLEEFVRRDYYEVYHNNSKSENKIIDLESQISDSDKHIGEWNEMNELFSKTLRYGLLDTLIPHVNKSIK